MSRLLTASSECASCHQSGSYPVGRPIQNSRMFRALSTLLSRRNTALTCALRRFAAFLINFFSGAFLICTRDSAILNDTSGVASVVNKALYQFDHVECRLRFRFQWMTIWNLTSVQLDLESEPSRSVGLAFPQLRLSILCHAVYHVYVFL